MPVEVLSALSNSVVQDIGVRPALFAAAEAETGEEGRGELRLRVERLKALGEERTKSVSAIAASEEKGDAATAGEEEGEEGEEGEEMEEGLFMNICGKGVGG